MYIFSLKYIDFIPFLILVVDGHFKEYVISVFPLKHLTVGCPEIVANMNDQLSHQGTVLSL